MHFLTASIASCGRHVGAEPLRRDSDQGHADTGQHQAHHLPPLQPLVEHHSTELVLLRRLRGQAALPIISTIIRNGWVTVLGHGAYLGRELGKAEMALRRGWAYEQNKELNEK